MFYSLKRYRFNNPKSTLEMNVLNYHKYNLGECCIALSSKWDSHFSFFSNLFSVTSENVFFLTSVPFHIVIERDTLS